MSAILPGLQRVLGGMSSRRRASVRRIGMLLVWAALLVVVQSNLPYADVAHSQTDTTLPALTDRAQVVADVVTLYFDEVLDEDSTPAVTDFAVTADGSTIAVTGIFRDAEIVGLTLTSPVYEGQTVLVSYTPGTNRIQNLLGNEAAAFTDVQVLNLSDPRPGTPPTDNTPPQLSEDLDEGVTVVGTKLILVYNEDLDLSSNPATTDYTVSTDGESVTVVRVTVSARFVTLDLAVATYKGENLVLSYTPGTNPVRDTSGNPAGALGEVAVVNLSDPEPPPDNMMPPLLTSRSYVDFDLYLVYNELLAEGSVPPASAYTIRIDGTAVAIEEGNEGVLVHQMLVIIQLAPEASQGQTVTQIPHLEKRKTSLEPDAMRAKMFVAKTKPSPTRCIHYEARRSAVPVRGGEELDGHDGAVRPAGVP